MARSTTSEQIAALEAELASLKTQIEKQQHLQEVEEGGAGSRFRTVFTKSEKLFARRKEIENQLAILYNGTLL